MSALASISLILFYLCIYISYYSDPPEAKGTRSMEINSEPVAFTSIVFRFRSLRYRSIAPRSTWNNGYGRSNSGLNASVIDWTSNSFFPETKVYTHGKRSLLFRSIFLLPLPACSTHNFLPSLVKLFTSRARLQFKPGGDQGRSVT